MIAKGGSTHLEFALIKRIAIVFIIQIMQGVNSLYNSGAVESKKDAFLRMEQIRKKGNVQDDDAELASYREEKYGK